MYSIELKGIKEALGKCSPKIVLDAARSAINQTAAMVRTAASQDIRADYNIKAERLQKGLKVESNASGSSLQAVIVGRGKGFALSYFDAKQKWVSMATANIGWASSHLVSGKKVKVITGYKGGRRRGGDVTAKVKKQGGRKVISGDRGFAKPFLAQTSSGHIGVWQRIPGSRMKSKNKEALHQMYGPDVGLLFGSKRIMNNAIRKTNEIFQRKFEYELERRSKTG